MGTLSLFVHNKRMIIIQILLSKSPTAWTPPSGLFEFLLVAGALLTGAVGVFVYSFYADEYWADPEYRNSLRLNPEDRKRLS